MLATPEAVSSQDIATPKGIDVTAVEPFQVWPVETEKVWFEMSTSRVAGSMRILLYRVFAFVPGEASPAVYCAKLDPGPTCCSERNSWGELAMPKQNAVQGLFGS